MSAFAVGVVLGQLVSLAPPGYTGTLLLTDRSEVRLRSNVGTPESVDLETIPAVAIDLKGRRSAYLAGYTPRMDLFDITNVPQFGVMQIGRFSASYWTRHFRLILSVTGSIGQENAAGLVIPINLPEPTVTVPGVATAPTAAPAPATPTPPAPTQLGTTPNQPTIAYALPPGQLLHTGSFRGSVTASEAFSPRWTGLISAYYTIAGGLLSDYAARKEFPPSQGVGADVSAACVLSRQDGLVTSLHTEYTYVLTTADKFLSGTLTESYRHSWSPRTQGSIGLGISASIESEQLGQTALGGGLAGGANAHTTSGGIFGAGDASITHTEPLDGGASWVNRVGVQVAQIYNPILGVLQDQASASFASSWTDHKVSVVANVSAATSLPPAATDPSRIASGAVTFAYSPSKAVTLQTGVRAYAQLLPVASSAYGTFPPQWATFVALLLTAPPLRF